MHQHEGVNLLGDQGDQGGGSLERGLDPLQFFLDLPTLPLAGLLDAGIRAQELRVKGREPGNAVPKVVLQLSIWAVWAHGRLEGMNLAHNLRDTPESRTDETSEMRMQNKKGRNIVLGQFFAHRKKNQGDGY